MTAITQSAILPQNLLLMVNLSGSLKGEKTSV